MDWIIDYMSVLFTSRSQGLVTIDSFDRPVGVFRNYPYRSMSVIISTGFVLSLYPPCTDTAKRGL